MDDCCVDSLRFAISGLNKRTDGGTTITHTITISAVGDVALCGDIAAQIERQGASWPMSLIRQTLDKSDLVFGNMESVIVPKNFPNELIRQGALVSNIDGSSALVEAGFAFMNLASNHILDGGIVGMQHTQARIHEKGISTGGIGDTQEQARAIVVVERKGVKVGFLCYADDSNYSVGTRGPCHAYFTREAALEDVRRHRSGVDVLVVSIHGDQEFMETPSMPRRTVSRELARAGATIVLQHHPHVPQGIEMIGNSLVAYSLGDFCFPVYNSSHLRTHLPRTAESFVLQIAASKHGVVSFSREPFVIPPPPNQRPTPARDEARSRLLDYFKKLDEMVIDDGLVMRNWRRVAWQRFEFYLEKVFLAETPQQAKLLLGKLLFVAENAAWMQEVYRMTAEQWAERQDVVDDYRSPSCQLNDLPRISRIQETLVRVVKRLSRKGRLRSKINDK